MGHSRLESTTVRHRTFWVNPLIVLSGTVLLLVLSELIAVSILSVSGINLRETTNITLFWYSLVKLLAFGGLLCLARSALRFRWQSLGFTQPSWKAIFLVLPVFTVYIVSSGIVMFVAARLIPGFDIRQVQDVGFREVGQARELVLSGIVLIMFTPLIEEVLFRGVLFRGLRCRLPFWLSTLVVSVVFAAAHGQWNVATDTFVFSLALCWLAEHSRSIVPAILLHALKNAVAFTLLFIVGVQ